MKINNLSNAVKAITDCIQLKYLIAIFAFGFLSLSAMANPQLATKQQIGMFKNSTLCVVLENGNFTYNAHIKDAIEKHWKSTEYVFISQEEFSQRHFDSKYSFLVLMKGVLGKDPGGVSYNYLSLVLGDAATNLTDMPELCSFPVSYSDDNSMEYAYVIPAMVKFMQKHALMLETKRFMIWLRGLKYYNGSLGFKGKVLLLNKNSLAPAANTSAKIKTEFPHYFKILEGDEIQKEIETDPENAVFNLHVGPDQQNGSGKCFEMIFDDYGNLYYYNSRDITNKNKDGINLNDFKRL